MKIAIFSDLHANGAALDAFIEDTQKDGVTEYWFLGDAVGYGPKPIKTLKWILSNVSTKRRVWGNHDMMLQGMAAAQDKSFCRKKRCEPINLEVGGIEFAIVENLVRVSDWQATNPEAIQIIQKHLQEFSSTDWFNHRLLMRMYRDERTRHFNHRGTEHWFVHGTQDAMGDNYRYLSPWSKEYQELELAVLKENHSKRNQIHWSGHTHVPMLLVADQSDQVPRPIFHHYQKKISVDFPYVFLNPGSLGFPRDLDQRGSYLLYYPEEREVEFKRIKYPHREVYKQMKKENYPEGILMRFRDATFAGKENEFKTHFMKLKEEKI